MDKPIPSIYSWRMLALLFRVQLLVGVGAWDCVVWCLPLEAPVTMMVLADMVVFESCN